MFIELLAVYALSVYSIFVIFTLVVNIVAEYYE